MSSRIEMSGFAIGIARSALRTTAGDLVQIGELSSGGSYVARQEREPLSRLAAERFRVIREGKGAVQVRSPQHVDRCR